MTTTTATGAARGWAMRTKRTATRSATAGSARVGRPRAAISKANRADSPGLAASGKCPQRRASPFRRPVAVRADHIVRPQLQVERRDPEALGQLPDCAQRRVAPASLDSRHVGVRNAGRDEVALGKTALRAQPSEAFSDGLYTLGHSRAPTQERRIDTPAKPPGGPPVFRTCGRGACQKCVSKTQVRHRFWTFLTVKEVLARRA
jgi:hypothetical protein